MITIPLGGSQLKQWTVQVTFGGPVYDIEVWDADPHQVDSAGNVWHFTAKSWDAVVTGQLQFNFLGNTQSQNVHADVVYCGDGDKPGSGGNPDTTTDSPGTGSTPDTPYPTLDPDNGLCQGPKGRNVAESHQSVVGGYTPSSDKYDYSEVIHKSILFFEAQRAGPQPANNRILWRGDAGLHDGCDVGANLSKGCLD